MSRKLHKIHVFMTYFFPNKQGYPWKKEETSFNCNEENEQKEESFFSPSWKLFAAFLLVTRISIGAIVK